MLLLFINGPRTIGDIVKNNRLETRISLRHNSQPYAPLQSIGSHCSPCFHSFSDIVSLFLSLWFAISTTIDILYLGANCIIRDSRTYVWRVRYGFSASQIAFVAHHCLCGDILNAILDYSTRNGLLLRIKLLSFNIKLGATFMVCGSVQFS